MTPAQISKATGSTMKNANIFREHLNYYCDKFGIDSPVNQLCFLSQVGHESGGLFYTEELASGSAYENRHDIGNIMSGDGRKYKGRGLIQITGRSNYETLKKITGVDFISHPELLGGKNISYCTPDQIKNSALSAAWFWNHKKLSSIAERINIRTTIEEGENLKNFKSITRIINGGYNGLQDRVSRYKAGLNFFI